LTRKSRGQEGWWERELEGWKIVAAGEGSSINLTEEGRKKEERLTGRGRRTKSNGEEESEEDEPE